DEPGREAGGVAAHHAGALRLALQPLRGTCGRGSIAGPEGRGGIALQACRLAGPPVCGRPSPPWWVTGSTSRPAALQGLYARPPNRYGGPMLRLTQAPNIAIATLWADLLCEAGMAASVQRQYLGAAAGHLPPDQCLPEIWLDHEEHAS